MTVLLVHGDREYLREPGEELQTDLGVLEIPEDAEPGDSLETHLGEPFEVRGLRGPDLFNHLERTGAPMMPRDVVEAAREAGLADVETLETIQRRMDFDDRGSRPSTAGVGHTGYLTFARRP